MGKSLEGHGKKSPIAEHMGHDTKGHPSAGPRASEKGMAKPPMNAHGKIMVGHDGESPSHGGPKFPHHFGGKKK